MAKSIDVRRCVAAEIFKVTGAYKELNNAPYKSGVQALADTYDKNLMAYGGYDGKQGLVKRKADLSKILDKISVTLSTMREALVALQAEDDKAHEENVKLFHEAEDEIKFAYTAGDKAEPAVVIKQLEDFNSKFAKVVKQDKVFADKKDKIGSQGVADLKKLGDSYEKESIDINKKIDALAVVENGLETQITAIIKTNMQIAAQKKYEGLKTSLQGLLTFVSVS